MSEPIRHVVLTRFAVKVTTLDGVAPKVTPVPLTPEWLAVRFALFEQYLLPSMLAQTFTDWTWRIYVHPEFDPALADRLRAYDPRIEVCRDPVTPLLGVDAGLVASTRIDSDDGFASNAMEVVNQYAERFAASPDKTRLLRLKQGWWADHQRGRAYQCRGWSFLTVFERHAPYHGAMVRSCDDIALHYKEWTEKAPLWLRVVHGGNVRNRFNVAVPTVPVDRLRSQGFAWLPASAPVPEPAIEDLPRAPLPRLAVAMRTTRRTKENYVKRTVSALVAQGVRDLQIQCSKVADAAWLRGELGAAAEAVTILPTARDLTPNATALAALASLDLAQTDWVLLLEDDLRFCSDFVPSVRRWLATQAAADRNVFRFWGFHRPRRPTVRAFDHPLDKMAASQAVALRREDAADFLAWATAHLHTWRLPGKADPSVAFDKLIAAWALARWPQRPGVLSWPFFVDHIGAHSSIHVRGGMNRDGFAGPAWAYREGAHA